MSTIEKSHTAEKADTFSARLEKGVHHDGGDARHHALVWEAMAGDHRAFETLITIHRQRIFRMVYTRIRSEMDAQDLTQEIFIKAFSRLSRLRDPQLFPTWLFSIAVNQVRDFFRKKRLISLFKKGAREEAEMNLDPYVTPEGPGKLLKDEFWDKVERFSQKLSNREREVFYLRFMDQLEIGEIAKIIKRSESTTKSHLYRAIAKFKNSPEIRAFLPQDDEK